MTTCSCTLQARFALSTDAEFQVSGSASHIDYMDDYYKYLGYLKKGLRLKTKSVIALFKEWNQTFFGSDMVSNRSNVADESFISILNEMENESQTSDVESEEQEPWAEYES